MPIAVGRRNQELTASERREEVTSVLGVHGWRPLDPVLLAALALEAPLLLVGPHGTAKSLVVERVARATGSEFRHYNASLFQLRRSCRHPAPRRARRGRA